MLNKKEILNIIIIILVLALSISLFHIKDTFLPTLLAIAIIVILNVGLKKLTSHYLDIKIDVKMWEVSQWGFKRHFRFKRPLNLGIITPIVLKVISLGYLNFTASLVFDVKAKVYRAAKKHGLYAFSEISEAQIGAIAAVGIAGNIIASILGYVLGFPDFVRLNLGFAFWNLLPISNFDGNKIFFGGVSRSKGPVLWCFLMLLVLVGLFLSIFMV